jgi:LysM domain-containing protein
MERILLLFFILCSLLVALRMPAAAESQTWKIKPGDNVDTIAATLEIPREEIKKQNPGVLESNLQIGQKLKLPLLSYAGTDALQNELGKKDAQIGDLERKRSDLEKKITNAESQLRWHPIWFWGFWLCFSIIAFIISGACWIFRQTHPRVLEQPHERSINDVRESQIRVRSSFPHEAEGASGSRRQWQPSLKRFPHTVSWTR